MKIYYHHVAINKKPQKGFQWDDKFEIEEVEVIAENERMMVIDDDYFTRINTDVSHKTDPIIGIPFINIRTGESAAGDGVFYTLYSFVKKSPGEIKSEIEAELAKNFSWITVDLSIIK